MNDDGKKKRRKQYVSKRETPGRMELFLKYFAIHGHVSRAAREAGLAPSTAYNHIRKVPDLQRRFHEAEELVSIALRDEILSRAMDGVVKPVFYKGHKCGEFREYSERLLIRLLRARCPEFGSNYQQDTSDEAKCTLPKIIIDYDGHLEDRAEN